MVEGDEVDVYGIEDQLHRHEDRHQIPARQETVDADEEQERAQDEEMIEAIPFMGAWWSVSGL